MKKFLAFLLAAGMLTGIAACGTTKDNDTTTSSEKPSETTARRLPKNWKTHLPSSKSRR